VGGLVSAFDFSALTETVKPSDAGPKYRQPGRIAPHIDGGPTMKQTPRREGNKRPAGDKFEVDLQGSYSFALAFMFALVPALCQAQVPPQYAITTIAGQLGVSGYAGDGGPATNAFLFGPSDIIFDSSGNLYIADTLNNRVRQVNLSSSIINTVAGSGTAGYAGDGSSATASGTELRFPSGMTFDSRGNFYIADTGNYVIREVNTSNIISTVAGDNGLGPGFSGDLGLATSARLWNPTSVAVDSAGNIYIADPYNNVVRVVCANQTPIACQGSGVGDITTFAGNHAAGPGYTGDGGPPTKALLNNPVAVLLDPAGNLYISDSGNNAIRKVSTSGIITTVAGGTQGLNGPKGIALDSSGNLYIADTGNCVIRMVNTSGIITTIAGTGKPGSSGDGGEATSAQLTFPSGVAVNGGKVYIADNGNNAIRLLTPAAQVPPPAQTFTALVNFSGSNGALPYGSLIQGTDGNFYGTTSGGYSLGGANNWGTVFKLTPSGTLTTLYSFALTDGASPIGGLIQATDGNLYGTTNVGGASSNCYDGCGTVFRITPAGELTTLHSFSGTDGELPRAGLAQGTDGDFYGTTSGSNLSNGTIFKITSAGELTTLHSFSGTDGQWPFGTLVQAANGYLYGTTTRGGGNSYTCEPYGCGTVFEITLGGALTTLHSFDYTDGGVPEGGLFQGANGYLYGTTSEGGASTSCSLGCGTVFKITPSGTLTTLHSFSGTDGGAPTGGLAQGTDGNFYGTTAYGGANNICNGGCGTIFNMTPVGALTTLHSFGETDGDVPYVGLVQATNGNFYGTATYGGANSSSCDPPYGCGTVFSLSVGLGPFVETLPASGNVGTAVNILGTNLTGASTVTFNGTAAVFTVVSPSLITTTVPVGSTTGTVQVTTPGDTLLSNAPFTVTPASGPQAPSINPGGVVNAASYTAPVAPGSIAAAYGNFLLSSPSTAPGLPLPTNLSGLSMQFGGFGSPGVPVPLFYASGGQVNLQVPWELAGQTQTPLTVSVSSQTSASRAVNLAPFAPAIFSTNAQGTGQGAILDTSYQLVDALNPATPGTTYIQIYCTGLGPVTYQPSSGSPAPSSPPLAETTTTPTVTIGNVPAQVLFSGLAPGFVGLYQVNAQVPAGTPGGAAVPVTVSMEDTTSNTVTMAVQGTTPVNPKPSISSLSPASATAGSGPLTLTISGSGFIGTSSVSFNGVVRMASFVDNNTLTITLSASDLAVAGSFPVVVTNPSPGGGTSSAVNFTVVASQASVAGVWQGTWTSITGISGSFGASLTQAGSALTGTLLLTGSSCFAIGNATGTISGATLSLGLVFGNGGQVSFSGTIDTLGTVGQGQYSVISGPCGGDYGTFSLMKVTSQISVTGTWQGTFLSVTGLTGSLAANITQNGIALAATISLTGSPCFTNGTASGNIIAETISLGSAFSGGQQASFDGTVDSSGSSITGQYAVLTGACAGDNGTFAVARVQ
jgi:uncharacterized protein (TIGR03437 family)